MKRGGHVNKFEMDSKSLLQYIGGKENILVVTHCVTRIRFILKNIENVQIDKLENLESVMGTFTELAQFQVIIGSEVESFFEVFCKTAGIQENEEKDKLENINQIKQGKPTIIKKIGNLLESYFSPIR